MWPVDQRLFWWNWLALKGSTQSVAFFMHIYLINQYPFDLAVLHVCRRTDLYYSRHTMPHSAAVQTNFLAFPFLGNIPWRSTAQTNALKRKRSGRDVRRWITVHEERGRSPTHLKRRRFQYVTTLWRTTTKFRVVELTRGLLDDRNVLDRKTVSLNRMPTLRIVLYLWVQD